jgi:methanogenic corrinoid protein MtbC1
VGKLSSATDCRAWVPPAELGFDPRVLEPLPRFPEPRGILKTVIENDVIPRLLLTNEGEAAEASPSTREMAALLAERVGEFSELVVKQDDKVAMAYVEKLLGQGIPIESLFEDLLAPVARRLGELWTEDINDFFDVTTGIGRLQHIVRTFGRDFCDEGHVALSSRCALLMPLPEEQHTFGISLLRENLLREGWRVWCGQCTSMNEVVQLVKIQPFDMVGLSGSAVHDPEALARDVKRIRAASANKDVKILVGGYAFNSQPDLVAAIGADGTATDARQAVHAVVQAI